METTHQNRMDTPVYALYAGGYVIVCAQRIQAPVEPKAALEFTVTCDYMRLWICSRSIQASLHHGFPTALKIYPYNRSCQVFSPHLFSYSLESLHDFELYFFTGIPASPSSPPSQRPLRSG